MATRKSKRIPLRKVQQRSSPFQLFLLHFINFCFLKNYSLLWILRLSIIAYWVIGFNLININQSYCWMKKANGIQWLPIQAKTQIKSCLSRDFFKRPNLKQ